VSVSVVVVDPMRPTLTLTLTLTLTGLWAPGGGELALNQAEPERKTPEGLPSGASQFRLGSAA
jgi:hypothetical protein